MKYVLGTFLSVASLAVAASREVRIDAAKVVGQIRSFQGVNGGPAPLVAGKIAEVSQQYKDVRIDFVRTHDFFGPTDIDAQWPNPDPIAQAVKASGENSIFRDWNADPNHERSYNFGPSDRVIQAIVESGAAVYYRLGRSWSANPVPPPDPDKFANICRHVAMHFNGGWAGGYYYKIRYWEVWNEPDVKQSWDPKFIRPFWTGTPDQFYRLYEKTAQALKSYDPTLHVGACGQAAGGHKGPYREGLIEYCAAHKVPLDFFSWHHYHNAPADPGDMVRIGKQVRELLDRNGFPRAETHVTEWNLSRSNPARASQNSAETAAFVVSVLIALQDSALERSFFYRGDATGTGLFERDGRYRRKAYVFKAAGAMLDTPQRLAVTGTDTHDFLSLAGRSADRKKVQVLVCNYRGNPGYTLALENLPWGQGPFRVKRHRITEADDFTRPVESLGTGGKLELTSNLPAPGVEWIVLEP